MKNLRIYTDGAYSSARNQGGIGIVFVQEDDGNDSIIAEISKDIEILLITVWRLGQFY